MVLTVVGLIDEGEISGVVGVSRDWEAGGCAEPNSADLGVSRRAVDASRAKWKRSLSSGGAALVVGSVGVACKVRGLS